MSEQQVEKPTTDHSYFERMCRVIFGVRAELLNPQEAVAQHQAEQRSLVEVEQADRQQLALGWVHGKATRLNIGGCRLSRPVKRPQQFGPGRVEKMIAIELAVQSINCG
jgi:hypothetical protein